MSATDDPLRRLRVASWNRNRLDPDAAAGALARPELCLEDGRIHNINSEEPTESLDLDGALESKRVQA